MNGYYKPFTAATLHAPANMDVLRGIHAILDGFDLIHGTSRGFYLEDAGTFLDQGPWSDDTGHYAVFAPAKFSSDGHARAHQAAQAFLALFPHPHRAEIAEPDADKGIYAYTVTVVTRMAPIAD
jgi:hypothetical protein